METAEFDIHPEDVRGFGNLYADDDEPIEYFDSLDQRESRALENHPLIIEFCQSQGPMGEMEQTEFKRELLSLIGKLT